MSDCIFCKIVKGEISSKIVYEDEFVLGFEDINPVAPVHILVIPKYHLPSTESIDSQNSFYISKVFEAIPKISKKKNLDRGYRVVTNTGEASGQTVKHIHFHILGGKTLDLKMC
jgi:histidine triad (HIT) family protein